MGIIDWVWDTYINSSLTLLCACWLVAWPHFIHSVRPESNKITLAEINGWLWRSFCRAVTFPELLQRSQPLHAVIGQLCGGERGGRVWSFLLALPLLFFFLLSTRLNCFCHFPRECKTMNALQERLNMWAAIHIFKSYRVTSLRMLAFQPAFHFSAFFLALLTMHWSTLFYWSVNWESNLNQETNSQIPKTAQNTQIWGAYGVDLDVLSRLQ